MMLSLLMKSSFPRSQFKKKMYLLAGPKSAKSDCHVLRCTRVQQAEMPLVSGCSTDCARVLHDVLVPDSNPWNSETTLFKTGLLPSNYL
jgi:hypothetical protein